MKQPILFIGHGTPMNAIEDNPETRVWRELGEKLIVYKPTVILMISAHWYTRGSYIQSMTEPKQIYDMYGFPKELYDLRYPVKGYTALTERVLSLLGEGVSVDDEWGIDHGAWSVLVHLFPKANVPVVQLSVDGMKGPHYHKRIGELLRSLRDEGVLIIGSGNIVHNLGRIQWSNEGGTPQADTFDQWVKEGILHRDVDRLLNYESYPDSSYAVPTPDHFYPLYYCYGASESDDQVEVFNDLRCRGSLSMTGYLWESP